MLGGVLCLATVGNVFVDFVADRVIEKLEKDYSPSPYGPGIDPDKVDMRAFNQKSEFDESELDESKPDESKDEWGKTWD